MSVFEIMNEFPVTIHLLVKECQLGKKSEQNFCSE
jgi:hypothetical protein